jgi:hypothetical protein
MRTSLLFLTICSACFIAGTAKSQTAPAYAAPQPEPRSLKEALIEYRWTFHTTAKPKSQNYWTKLQFNPSGSLTIWHENTEQPKATWEIVAQNAVKIHEFLLVFDAGFTSFQRLGEHGGVLAAGARAEPTGRYVVETSSQPPPPAQPIPPSVPQLAQILSQQGPNIMDWALSPLDTAVPPGFREKLMQLKDGLLDDAAKSGQPYAGACNDGAQFCNAMLLVLNERDTKISQLNASSAVDAPSDLNKRRQDFTGDPWVDWPEYQRERGEARQRNRDAAATNEFFNQGELNAWTQRAGQLRQTCDAYYEQFRVALRSAPALQ